MHGTEAEDWLLLQDFCFNKNIELEIITGFS